MYEYDIEEVEIHGSNILPNITGMRGPLTCLNNARYGIAWGALGAASECLVIAGNIC